MKIVAWSVLIVVLVLFAVKALFVGYYRIPQNGRYPTLPAGSVLFTIRRPYSDISAVKRGDVIVFVREQNGQRYNYIWRVIGLPGDAIQTSGESLILNGRPAARERLPDADGKSLFRESIGNVSYEIAFDSSASERPPDAPSPFRPIICLSWATIALTHSTAAVLEEFHLARLSERSSDPLSLTKR